MKTSELAPLVGLGMITEQGIAKAALDEYCTFCGRSLRWLSPGDAMHLDTDKCACRCDCCKETSNHPHMPHIAIRRRECGEYRMDEEQLALLNHASPPNVSMPSAYNNILPALDGCKGFQIVFRGFVVFDEEVYDIRKCKLR